MWRTERLGRSAGRAVSAETHTPEFNVATEQMHQRAGQQDQDWFHSLGGLDDWLALERDLCAAGKEVVLVAQTLIETEADLRLLERQGEQAGFAVEAGDASALQLLAGRVPLVLGPHLNIYSRPALVEHADLGATCWVAPVELALDSIARINPPADPVRTPAGVPIATEAWAFGRLPLSFSARCFTARHHRVAKDDGLLLSSTDGQRRASRGCWATSMR